MRVKSQGRVAHPTAVGVLGKEGSSGGIKTQLVAMWHLWLAILLAGTRVGHV